MPELHQARSRRPAVRAGDIIEILREAHQAVEAARARGHTVVDAEMLDKLGQRYDEAAAFGVILRCPRFSGQGIQ